MFYLGGIPCGNSIPAGPTEAQETRTSTLVQHAVARGKPVVQDMGDELDTKSLSFFWDEVFCTPTVELARLENARAAREPLAYVGGDGSFTGVRYLVESIDVTTVKTTPLGTPTRMEVTAQLLEVPIPSPLDFLSLMARQAAPALMSFANSLGRLK
jgi:phage protein U